MPDGSIPSRAVRSNHIGRRLSAAEILDIRNRAIRGEAASDLAVEFGIAYRTARTIIRGEVWQDIKATVETPRLPVGPSEYALIPGWDGFAAGKDGTIWQFRNGRWCLRKCKLATIGYVMVELRCPGKRKEDYAHRLVLLAFIGRCPEGMEACHWNGIKTDNRLENLRWDTKSANAEDSRRHGTMALGERRGTSVWTREVVLSLRAKFPSKDYNYKEVVAEAKRIGMPVTTAQSIINRRVWKWLN